MSRRDYFLLGLFGFALVLIVSFFQTSPGYMDADYYLAGGISLSKGLGFNEYILWNYLDDPSGIPHPSHAYWMPLASMLSAMGMVITGVTNFSSGRTLFILIVSAIAPLTARLSYSIYRLREYALLAGIFAAIPAFYLAYLGTTDTFGLYMVLGCLWLLIAGDPGLSENLKLSLLGLVSGLMHLGRADGVVWLFLGFLYLVIGKSKGKFSVDLRATLSARAAFAAAALVGGYLVIMGPWMLRNLSAFGSLLSPAGLSTLWLVHYDDLYAYPGDQITFARWLASGAAAILRARWNALSINLQTAFAVQGAIFLTPLIIAGLWKARQHRAVIIGLLYWLITLFIMTGIFPEVGWRGGFFHSGAAIQPLFWAAAPAGLAEFVRLGVQIRRWNWKQAWSFFRAGSILLLAILTLITAGRRLSEFGATSDGWDQSARNYTEIEAELDRIGAAESDIVMVNNPPGYYVATGRPAISIPDGGVSTTLAVAERYGGKYLILEPNHPRGMVDVYNRIEGDAWLQYIKTIGEAHIFRISAEQ